jgi:very-short-patch-repair endonuclease
MREGDLAIRAIKPCFLMSPQSVSQLLPGSEPSFDLVVFDEASQLPPEDAVGAIIRGKQLVVVGDPKQLPPTNFFASLLGQALAFDEDGNPIYEDGESILEEYAGAGVPKTRLRWHYRSAHESLISFSNLNFYDSELYTFPSIETDSDAAGLQFVYVPNGVYEGKGLNRAEAKRVADAVVEHAKRHPDLTLGVGTFNLRQQIAIQDELEVRRRADPTLETFFSRSVREPFFVKNLENVQGDERDVVFISVTYAKGTDGRLRYNFGPLNSANGWRRLNVLTTRARRRMRVFSSIKGDEINPTATASDGPRLLRDLLVYAEHGRLDSPSVSGSASTESLFEKEVYTELSRHGLLLEPQVGTSGYRIDLAVRDETVPGRFICGIECDGAAYHASETARDRDRLRQEVLEARGWTILRVWSTDWFKDRQGQVSRLLEGVAAARRRAVEEAEAEAQSRIEEPLDTSQGSSELSTGSSSVSQDVEVTASDLPAAEAYRIFQTQARFSSEEILDASASKLIAVVREVLLVEAPLHQADLMSRVADMWGVSRVGSRIAAKLLKGLEAAARQGVAERRGEFVWRPGGACAVRSRSGTGISAERIPPEEYREAVLLVVRAAQAVSRQELGNRVRSLLGFSRMGSILEESIDREIESLLASGVLGEGSGGLSLRG